MATFNAALNVNLVSVKIIDIVIYKFGKKDKLSIMPQFLELNLYPSLWRSTLRADMVINDNISLHANYPLIGEEIIEISYQHTADDINDARSQDQGPIQPQDNQTVETITFNVTDVTPIIPDDKARGSLYSLTMHSPEYLLSVQNNVMRAFNKGYHENIPVILKEYLKTTDKKIDKDNFEPCKGQVLSVVPNLEPLPAIMWMTKRAVPMDTNHSFYTFYEDLEGFKFKTIQKMIADGKQKKRKKSYIYFSNVLKDQNLSQPEQTSIAQSTVSSISQNKRYSTQEKISQGYFENEYFEIDLFNRKVNSTPTELKTTPVGTIANTVLNTSDYIQAQKSKATIPGSKTRVVYSVFQGEGDDPAFPNHWRDKFGEGSRAITAMSQVQLTISVPGDTRVMPGDMIELELPEFHGFNQVQDDPYVSGNYIVTDIKHIISAGMKHVMVMNIARDTFSKSIAENHNYNVKA